MADTILNHLGTHGRPPNRTDTRFSREGFVRSNTFNALYMAFSIGITLVLSFILLSFIQTMDLPGVDLKCLETLIPCYSCSEPFANIWAFIFIFLYGLVFGSLLAWVYNSLVMGTVIESYTYDTFV